MEKAVGQTASVGFQIGVRRTLPITQEQAWELLTSSDGVKMWLGDVSDLAFSAGSTYLSEEGTSGELRIVKPHEQLRLTWQKRGWATPSTLQIRLLPKSPEKTTISFHQEKLASAVEREEMKLRWEAVLSMIGERFAPLE